MAVCVSELAESSLVPAGKIVSSPAHSTFFSQLPELQQAVAAATQPLSPKPHWTPSQQAVASVYNRLGGLLSRLAVLTKIPVAVALAVWYLEGSGRALVPNQAIIRFEVGRLLTAWGNANSANFDAHFHCGGRNGIPGASWQSHAFSAAGGGPFVPVHTSQASEYAALKLAGQLAGQEIAARCISIGGCQIMISNYLMLGYTSATDMYNAFQFSENAHVLGFFDFCARQGGGLFGFLQQQDFASFALHYNGPGQVLVYAAKLQSATNDMNVVLGGS